jgi:hypothetical protein
MGPGGAKGSSGVEPVIAEIGPVLLWYYGLAHAIGLLIYDLWVWLWRERVRFEGRDVADFSPLVALLCLTIPSGWAPQDLEDFFESRRDVTSSAETECGGNVGKRGNSHS